MKCPPRRVPIAMQTKLRYELDGLVDLKVITPVTEPTEWCSQISVQTKKNGRLRICIDPRPLNEVLQRETYPLPTIDDLLPELANAKVFSKVDLSNGYWHCELDEASSLLTTFVTPYGRYRWLRLPFGTKVSSEIFQRKLNENLEGLKGVVCVADDILIFGISDDDHDENLRNLLIRCKEHNIKLNKDKCVFKTAELDFLGHVVTNKGLKPDQKKVAAILQMPNPTDVEAVRRLQGMITYLAKFLPQLSSVMEPIRRLTRQDCEWEWAQEQETLMAELNKLVTSVPLLAYYDPSKELVIQCDASSTGLGSTLMQEGKPLAYASRALSTTEVGYAQIEKECLAIVFSLERFHQYTFGRKTIVNTDHKPLETIVKKPLCKAPKRIQGMLLRLLQYDIVVKYTKGKEMHIADTLSRAYLADGADSCEQFSQIKTVEHLPIGQSTMSLLRTAIAEDGHMQTLKQTILAGWPDNRADVNTDIASYFSMRDELAVHDGLIFRGECVIVPQGMRKHIKKRLHLSHLGADSMVRRARECVFWPGMAAEIKQLAGDCEACQTLATAQQKETLMPIESILPWEKVGADLFSWSGKDYLLTIDYFSGWWEVDRLNDTTATAVIRVLKAHFGRWGIPSTLISDNGPQFTAAQFQTFLSEWEIQHHTSAPGHPNANGKAESGVKAAKQMMEKCKRSNTDPFMALLEIRNTPTQGVGSSPSQRLINRRTRTLLPMTHNLLRPRGELEHECDKLKVKHNQTMQATYYNRRAKDLPVLKEGDRVRLKPFRLGQKGWNKGTVVARLDERSYDIETPDGMYRRNRVHIRKDTVPEDAVPTAQRSAEPVEMAPQPMSNADNRPNEDVVVRRSVRASNPPKYLAEYVLTKK